VVRRALTQSKNPDPYGSQSLPSQEEIVLVHAETALIAGLFTVDWRPKGSTTQMEN